MVSWEVSWIYLVRIHHCFAVIVSGFNYSLGLIGKEVELVSFASQDADATVIIPSQQESKIGTFPPLLAEEYCLVSMCLNRVQFFSESCPLLDKSCVWSL